MISDCDYWTLQGNTTDNAGEIAIYVVGSAAGYCRRGSVVGNIMRTGINGLYIYGDVANGVQHISVVANQAFGFSGNGILANANTDRITHGENIALGNGTNISFLGTNTVANTNIST